MELKPCPFCDEGIGHINLHEHRSGYGEYEHTNQYYAVSCTLCGATGKLFYLKSLSEFTKFTVYDFRNNPILRAEEEEKYDKYKEGIKIKAIDAWNTRSPETVPRLVFNAAVEAIAKKDELLKEMATALEEIVMCLSRGLQACKASVTAKAALQKYYEQFKEEQE